MSEKLVTIRGYLNSTEANLAKEMLESAGIQAFLQGENFGALNFGTLSQAGCKILVREEDVEAAEEIFNDLDETTTEDEEAEN